MKKIRVFTVIAIVIFSMLVPYVAQAADDTTPPSYESGYEDGYHAGWKDGGASDTCLQEYCIDISLLKLVEDMCQFLLLLSDRLRRGGISVWPVDASDGGEPYGSDFMFRRLGMKG